MLVKHLGTYKTRDGRIVVAKNDGNISDLYLKDNDLLVGSVWTSTGWEYKDGQESNFDIAEEILPQDVCLDTSYKIPVRIKLSQSDYKKYEPTGEHRQAIKGEFYFNGINGISKWECDGTTTGFYMIFKEKTKPYQWPTINGQPMKGWGFAKDQNGYVFLYEEEPLKQANRWNSIGIRIIPVKNLTDIGIPVPEITDWEQPVLNPYYKIELIENGLKTDKELNFIKQRKS